MLLREECFANAVIGRQVGKRTEHSSTDALLEAVPPSRSMVEEVNRKRRAKEMTLLEWERMWEFKELSDFE